MTFDEAVISLNQVSHVLSLMDPELQQLVTIDYIVKMWDKADVIKVAEHLKKTHPEIYPN